MIRTENVDLIKKIVTHPLLWDKVSDDGGGNYDPIITNDTYYLLSDEGLIIYLPMNHCTWEIHSCILPKWQGKSVDFIKESMTWMFTNTRCKKIEARVPVFNIRAYKQAKRVGFLDEGLSKKSFLKNKELYDMYLLGVTCQ